MTFKSLTALLLLSVMLGTSCVRRTISQDLGIPGVTSLPHLPHSKPQAASSPDASLRALFKQQTQQGAVNPLNNDRHLQELKQAIAELPADDAQVGNLWNKLGLLYENMASLSAAQSAFEHAVAANPQSDTAHNNLGYSLLLQSRYDGAESEFRRALELNPSSSTARNNLGIILARRGDLQSALEQFLITGDAAAAHNNLAVVLLEAGQYEQSRQQLVEALNIRHYFAPALANFKLVQEKLREEAEVKKYGRLPLNPVRIPSSLVALGQMTTQEPEDTK